MKKLVTVLETITAIGMASVVAIVIGEVTLRAVSGSSFIITEEYSRYMMIWIAWIAIAIGVYEKLHIRITILLDKFSIRLRASAELAGDLVILLFAAVTFFATLKLLPSLQGQGTVTLGAPVRMSWFYFSLPFATALMALFILLRLPERLAGFREARPAKEETVSDANKVAGGF